MGITEHDSKTIKEYHQCIRMGSKTIKDIDDGRYRDMIVDIIKTNIKEGKSTGHERKALKEYNKMNDKEDK